MYKPKHFSANELFPNAVITKYGEQCWQFMDDRLLETIDFIREKIGKRIFVNVRYGDKKFQNRGYRANTYKTKLYCSQHLHGRAVDFDVEGMPAKDVRDWLKENADILPHPIWVEDAVTWVHIDVRQSDKGKIYFFKV